MKVSEVLERSLQTMEDEGWCKTGYSDENGRCVVGALWSVIGGELDWQEGGRLVMDNCLRALRQATGVANITYWNDHPDRTFDQVRQVFGRTIAAAEMKELVAV